MKFILMSDIHIDLVPWNWDSILTSCDTVNTVVIAGDISNDIWTTCNWLVEAKEKFTNVIWVAGNHDFYNQGFHKTRIRNINDSKWPYPCDVTEMLDHYEKWSRQHGIYFLHRSYVEVDGVKFFGATGWHDFVAGEPFGYDDQVTAWYKSLSDTTIRWDKNVFKPNHQFPLKAACEDAKWLTHALTGISQPCVVVTHHIPSRTLKWEMPHDIHWTKLHGSFVNTRLETVENKNIVYWCYGHTHQRQMKKINDTLYVCNSRGYLHENPNWTPIILEVQTLFV